MFTFFSNFTQIKCYGILGINTPFPEHSFQNCHQKVQMFSLLMIICVLSILLPKSYCKWKASHTNITREVKLFGMCCSAYYNKSSMDTPPFGWLWPGILSHAHTRLKLLQVQGRERKGKGKILSFHFICLKKENLEVMLCEIYLLSLVYNFLMIVQ